MIVLVLGGARSGKSELAERCAAALAGTGGSVTYVATGVATDDDFAARIAAHRARRPATWATVEAGAELAAVLARVDGPALVDSLGTWVASHRDFAVDDAELVAVLAARREQARATVLVSDEVGMGVHPATEVGRRFRDALGEVNRRVAAAADHVLLAVAGRTVPVAALDDGDLRVLLGLDGNDR